MSRLADALMGMDQGAERPHGVGGMPPLTVRSAARPKWLWGGLLVIVAGMATLSVGAVVRSRASVTPTDLRSAPRVAPAALAAASTRLTGDQRFVSLVKQALRSAEDGALVDAARLLKSALELKPDHAETWNSLGVVLVRADETARGMDAFRQALRFDPNHVEAHRNLAVALDRQGMTADAAPHYRAFLALSAERHPGRDDVRRRLTEVAVRQSGRRSPAGSEPGASRE